MFQQQGNTLFAQQQAPQQQLFQQAPTQPTGLFGATQPPSLQPFQSQQTFGSLQQPPLLPQQQQPSMGFQTPGSLLAQQPSAAVTANLSQAQDGKVLQQYRDNLKKLNREQEMQELRTSLVQLGGRVKNEFTSKYCIPKSSRQMNAEVSNILNHNLKMGLTLQHNNLLNDMLKALQDRLLKDKENRLQYTVPSYLKVGDLNCVSLARVQLLHSNAILNATAYQQHNISCVAANTFDRLARIRQNYRGSPSVIDFPTKRGQDGPKLVNRSEQVMQGLFSKVGLDDKILQYSKVRFDAANNPTSTSNVIEQIFDAMIKCSTQLSKDLDLLKWQFHNYSLDLDVTVGRELIVRNTVKYLEHQFRQGVDSFDIYVLNRKFQTIYLPQCQDFQVQSLNGIYPSGVLLVLARMGKTDLAKKVFESWAQSSANHPLVQEVVEYLQFAERQHYSLREVRNIYEGKLYNRHIDPIFKQLYLLLLQISEIEDLFESVHFKQDKDILLWLTLKTCHAQIKDDHILYEQERDQPQQLYMHLSLDELQESIPRQFGQGYTLDLQLQRYYHVLDQMSMRDDYVQQHPHEIALLCIIFKDAHLITNEQYQHIKSKTDCVQALAGYLFPTKPLLASVITKLGVVALDNQHQASFLRNLACQFVTTHNVHLLIWDDKFRAQYLDIVLERDEAQLEKLQIFVIQEHFKDQLVVLFGDAMASISPTSSRKQLFDALEQFNQKIDNLTQYLTHIKRINKHINRSIIILTQLVTETYFVSLYLESIVYQLLYVHHKVYFGDQDVVKVWKSMAHPETTELNHFLKIVVQDIFNDASLQEDREMKKLFPLLEVVKLFQQVIQAIKRDRKDIATISNALLQLNLPALVVPIRQERKEDLVFQLLWMVQVLQQNNNPKNLDLVTDVVRRTKDRLRIEDGTDYLDTSRPTVIGVELDIPAWAQDINRRTKQNLLLKFTN